MGPPAGTRSCMRRHPGAPGSWQRHVAAVGCVCFSVCVCVCVCLYVRRGLLAVNLLPTGYAGGGDGSGGRCIPRCAGRGAATGRRTVHGGRLAASAGTSGRLAASAGNKILPSARFDIHFRMDLLAQKWLWRMPQASLFSLGLGGRLGSGSQYLSWITRRDAVRAIEHVISTPSLSGPVNVVAPGAVSNAEFTGVGPVASGPRGWGQTRHTQTRLRRRCGGPHRGTSRRHLLSASGGSVGGSSC